ncbi:MAG: hypothetical protein FJ027_03480 [Candidatus Rokubacteria bacterium]|nr:hypothetical protein [Candidatus Rokubacteria bacterium]
MTGPPLTVSDYLGIAWRGRAIIAVATVIAIAVALVMVQLQPRVYAAKVTFLPPRDAPQSASGSLGAALMSAAGSGGGSGGMMMSFPTLFGGGAGMSSHVDTMVALLRSRALRTSVVQALTPTWGEDVGGRLMGVVTDTLQKGVVGVTVEATDGRLAAAAANAYVDGLDRMLESFNDQSATRRQASYTSQLERAAKAVEVAEQELLKFQTENRVLLNVDGPAKGAAESVLVLRSQITGLEMQREVLKLRFTDEHPQMRELVKQIAELKNQYSKSLFGGAMDLPAESPASRGLARKEFFVPVANMTPVQFSLLKLYRNLKIQEAFYTGALQGLQQLQYGGNDTSRIELLDPAEPSGSPIRPNVRFTVAAAAAGGFVVGIALVFIRAYVRLMRGARRPVRASRPMVESDPEAVRT